MTREAKQVDVYRYGDLEMRVTDGQVEGSDDKCDFCLGVGAVGYFQIAAFCVSLGQLPAGNEIIDDGQWNACPVCRDLLRAKRWLSLLDRCTRAHARILKMAEEDVRPQLVKKLYAVARAWTGEFHPGGENGTGKTR